MSIRHLFFILTLLAGLALLAGCSGDGPLGPSATEGPDQDQPKGASAAPIHMKVRNTIEIVPPFEPTAINAVFEGTAKSRPFGPCVLYSTSRIDVSVYPFIQVTDYVFTFMMGDELHGHSVGTGIEDPPGYPVFSGEITFTGGTGIFAQATGSGTYAGTADSFAGTGQFEIDGVISGFGGPGN